jgi:hypothetical protein
LLFWIDYLSQTVDYLLLWTNNLPFGTEFILMPVIKTIKVTYFLLLGIVKSHIFFKKILQTKPTFAPLIVQTKELLPYAADLI